MNAFDKHHRKGGRRWQELLARVGLGPDHGTVNLLTIVVRQGRRAQIPRMAAALAYRTIFGLIPVLVISLVVLAAFSKPEDVTVGVQKILKYAGLTQIVIDEDKLAGPMALPIEEPEAPMAPLAGVPADHRAARAAKLDQWIEGMVLRVRDIRLDAVGTVSLVMLIYAAISMMVEIEKAFNHIFLAPIGRAWTRRVPLYWTLLTLGSLCLAGSFLMQEAVQHFLDSAFAADGPVLLKRVAALVGTYGVTVGISTLLLLVAYTTVPNTRVKMMPALGGAITAAVLWEGAKWGFSEYVRYSTGTARLYGLIALLPLFLLWVYLTWIIVLAGLQMTVVLQTYGLVKGRATSFSLLASLGLVDDRPGSRLNGIVDPAAILPVMICVGERFGSGKPTDHALVATQTGVDERIVSEMLERLAGAGLLLRVAGEQEGMFTLARPPEAILATDVLGVGEKLSVIDRARAPGVMETLARTRAEAFAGRSLADMLAPARQRQAATNPANPPQASPA